MKRRTYNHSQDHLLGFTLVEMLVSVTLVLLMMTMFAAVFQIATGSVSTQRANAENDQKARMLTTIIRADFAKRTFRNLQPFVPGETGATSPTSFVGRSGYFYVSTNAAPSGFDDLIQFTINADVLTENTDGSEFFATASLLVDPVNGSAAPLFNLNQPMVDDNTLDVDGTASSNTAEVCYFIRNGNLYRRVLLIRNPEFSGDEAQPSASTNNRDFFAGYSDDTDEAAKASTYTGNFRLPGPTVYNPSPSSATDFSTGDDVLTNDFYRYFDFSAFQNVTTLDPGGAAVVATSAQFLGPSSLQNFAAAESGPAVSLGKPWFRFGFDPTDGLSREHVALSGGTAVGFMGRFLHAETSAANFNYPQRPAVDESGATLPGPGVGGNPFDIDTVYEDVTTTGAPVPMLLNKYGVIPVFDGSTGADARGGVRAQEDLLLSNVHEFRIELWDERFGDFVPPGHGETADASTTVGDLHISRFNGGFGADNRISGAVFDTWHPDMGPAAISVAALANQRAPYQFYEDIYPPSVPDGPSTASTGVSIATPGTGSSISYWDSDTQYAVGDVVFPRWEQIILDSTSSGTVGEFDPGIDVIQDQGYQFYYECVAVNDSGDMDTNFGESSTIALPNGPSWPTTHGRRFTENEVTWQCFDNRRSLKAARIKIRFQNEKSGDMRQLTLVLPLTDET